MSDRESIRQATKHSLDSDEVQGVLSGSFYTPRSGAVPTRPRAPKPQHYKVICISLYNSDLEQLDSLVDDLKQRGLTKANRSALIRYALSLVDVERVPRGL